MITVASILVLLWAMAFRVVFEVWQYNRKSREVVSIIARKGAVSPATACRPEDVGLRLQTSVPFLRLGFRDHRAEALAVLVQTKEILMTRDGRLYLSPQIHQSYVQQPESRDKAA